MSREAFFLQGRGKFAGQGGAAKMCGAGQGWGGANRCINGKKVGSFHIHRKTMKELCTLAVLGVREACFPIVYEHVHLHTC